jgi:soluble lytic murein transglycosylase
MKIVIYLISAIVALNLLPKAKKMTYKQIVEIYYDLAKKYSNIYNVPINIILAIIKQESAGNVFAIGKTSDYGLMQITKGALTDFNKSTGKNYNLFMMLMSPQKNIEVGTFYINWCKKFLNRKEYYDALRAYNVGVGNVQKSDTKGIEYADSVYEHLTTFNTFI